MRFFLPVLMACTSTPELEGRWVRADLHVHSSLGSNDTDGLGLPAALPDAMDRANLDVVFLTDHSNSQGSMDCADVEDCPNRGPERTAGDWPEGVYLASEISPISDLPTSSEPTGHIGCLARYGFDATFEDRPPGSMSGASRWRFTAMEMRRLMTDWTRLRRPCWRIHGLRQGRSSSMPR